MTYRELLLPEVPVNNKLEGKTTQVKQNIPELNEIASIPKNVMQVGISKYLTTDISEAFQNKTDSYTIIAPNYLFGKRCYFRFIFVFPYTSIQGSNSFIRLSYNYCTKKVNVRINGHLMSWDEKKTFLSPELYSDIEKSILKLKKFW
ncbi:hypothetical protein A9Q91_02005 [Candidatus Gracilibacteria bacterium 28_42_T64]|nr:hypothetical protein A9Q91_02005 [Candidatus Gracilibacteria bacterium 28_42_T64]